MGTFPIRRVGLLVGLVLFAAALVQLSEPSGSRNFVYTPPSPPPPQIEPTLRPLEGRRSLACAEAPRILKYPNVWRTLDAPVWRTNGRIVELKDGTKKLQWEDRRGHDADQADGLHGFRAEVNLRCSCNKDCSTFGLIRLDGVERLSDRSSQGWPFENSHRVSRYVSWTERTASRDDGGEVFPAAALAIGVETCSWLNPLLCSLPMPPNAHIDVADVPNDRFWDGSGLSVDVFGIEASRDAWPVFGWVSARCPPCRRLWFPEIKVFGLKPREHAEVHISWEDPDGQPVTEVSRPIEIGPQGLAPGSSFPAGFNAVLPEPAMGETLWLTVEGFVGRAGSLEETCESRRVGWQGEDLEMNLDCSPSARTR